MLVIVYLTHSSLVAAAKVLVPDGDDPLNGEVEIAVPEWYLLPAMHGPQLRVASKDAPFRFVEPKELADSLLRPAFKVPKSTGNQFPKAGILQLHQLFAL